MKAEMSLNNIKQIDREYNSLISYISIYVNIKKPKIEQLIINPSNNKIQIILNKSFKIIELSDDFETILDVLIYYAPKEINIYNVLEFNNRALLKIIMRIFKDKINLYEEYYFI